MEESQPPTKIVKFPNGEDFTEADEGSGRFVFAAGRKPDPISAAGPDPDPIFAFELGSAEDGLQVWAEGVGMGDELTQARQVVDRLPEVPSAGVDEAGERDRIEQLNSRLRDFSAKVRIPIDAPAFIEEAHKAGIFDSLILYQQSSYRALTLGLARSCPDVRWFLPTGGLSARSYGYNVALLYDQVNYGPAIARRTPTLTLVGTAVVPLSPRPILSVIFS
jgi:hypothetical protein